MATVTNTSGFVVPYKWDESRICQIKHKHGGFLRANPKNHEECNFKGGQTDWSKWKIYLNVDSSNANIIQIQNIKTLKYLEIDKKGKYVSVCNEGGLSSLFVRHWIETETETETQIETETETKEDNDNDNDNNNDNDDVIMNGVHSDDNKEKQNALFSSLSIGSEHGVKLESVRCCGLFLSVHPNNGVYINRDIDCEHNLLYFLVKGKTDDGLFKKAYLLKQQNTIIINHAFGGSIRVNDSDETVDSKGDKDILSQWESLPNEDSSILQFKNVKCGVFLCITDDPELNVSCCDAKNDPNTKFKVHVIQSPNIVKLESLSFENQFISVRQKGLCVGNGGPHSQMTLYRKD